MSTTPDHEVERLLNEGQAAARRGDRAMARALFTQLVERDSHNEEAWLWLSGVVTDPNEQQICLENALVINPHNAQARKGLEFVLAKTGTAARVPLDPPAASVAAAAPIPAPEPTAPTPANASWPQAESQPATPPLAEPQFQGEADSAPYSAMSAGEDAGGWPVQAAQSDDPLALTMPYPDMDFVANGGDGNGNGNGQFHPNGNSAGLAETVPYAAAKPAPTDTAFATRQSWDASYPSPPNNLGSPNNAGFPVDMDAQPFMPPGMASAASDPNSQAFGTALPPPSGKEIADNLPSWLDGLTPSVPVSDPTLQAPYAMQGPQEPQDGHFSPYDMPGFPSPNSDNYGAGMDMGMGDADLQTNMSMSSLGPYADLQMPSPHELPTDEGRGEALPPWSQQPDNFSASSASVPTPASGAAQPWYLQSGNLSGPPMPTGNLPSYMDSSMLNSAQLHSSRLAGATLDERPGKAGATLECPNCKEQVPETSLGCPQCRYSFFVNCPHCHELVDTSDAVPGQTSQCPYCKANINKMDMGMGGVTDLVSQKNPGARPAAAGSGPNPAFPSMKQTLDIGSQGRHLTFGWVIDLLWLVAIVAMVWALTQLPTWLNLPGQY